jgi:carboxypeptidase family protein
VYPDRFLFPVKQCAEEDFPLRESSPNKSPRSQNYSGSDAIQDWVSPFWLRSFPAAPREKCPPALPVDCLARPVNELLDLPSEHISALMDDLMLAVRTSLLVALSTLAIVLGTPVQLAGQDSATGSIRGTVVDPAGARVTQASIVVVNAGTGTQYTATSDSEGRFALELLPPGDYSARVETEGMSPQVSPSLHVDVGGVTAGELSSRRRELQLAGRLHARRNSRSLSLRAEFRHSSGTAGQLDR